MNLQEFSTDQLPCLLPDVLANLPEALRRSVEQHGVLVPPVTCDGVLCDGHRRLAAARFAGIKTLVCLETAGVPGLLFAELNSHRELTAFEAAAVFSQLEKTQQAAFLGQVGMSESPQMILALQFIAAKVLKQTDLLNCSLPVNVWRELGHLGEAIERFACPLLVLPGTTAEKRNIAALLRQAQRRNELPQALPGENAVAVLNNMQKMAQPRRTAAIEKFQNALAAAQLPVGAQLKIDQTFSQPGLQVSLQITRNHIERFDLTKKAVESIFAAVPEL